MIERIAFTSTSFDISIEFWDSFIQKPLLKNLNDKKKSLDYISLKLHERQYQYLNEWKEDVNLILNRNPSDALEEKIFRNLQTSFEKRFSFIVQVANCQFQTIIKHANDDILKKALQNTGSDFSFSKINSQPQEN